MSVAGSPRLPDFQAMRLIAVFRPTRKWRVLTGGIAVIWFAGCTQQVSPPAPAASNSATSPSSPATPEPQTFAPAGSPKEPPPADPKLAAFKAAIDPYLAEARAGADLLDQVPSSEKVTEITSKITEHHSRLPPAPEGIDGPGHIRQNLLNIKNQFGVAEFLAKKQNEISTRQQLSIFANDIRGFAKKVDAKIAEAAAAPKFP